jgi:hypothetical protein
MDSQRMDRVARQALNNILAGYAGTLDGTFLKFDPKSGKVSALHPQLKNM